MMSGPDSSASERCGDAPRPCWIWDLLAWAGLALATLVMLWPLGLTNRVLAGLDAFTYFEPYWAYRNAAMSAGRLPLWNPYLFLGVPFLANPQAAVLYPLHLPLTWLPADRALVWSALLHVWLAAGFTYTFARRSFQVTRPAAWLAGLLFGMGGFAVARVENINQLNALTWLPATLWLYDETARSRGWRQGLHWGCGLIAVITLQFLAGHMQTVYVNLVGLGLYAAYLPGRWVVRQLRGRAAQNTERKPRSVESAEELGRGSEESVLPPRVVWMSSLLPLLAVLPAVLLAAAQLLPSLELNRLGLRTGGLPFRQAVSFSLRPRLLAQSLLPPFGGGLADAFASEGYAEFVAYVGITGLLLAGSAAVRIVGAPGTARQVLSRGEDARRVRAPSGALLLLALAGLFLASGAYNPFYYPLWRFVPGFQLFRAPVRWLELTALGLAVLAAIGLDEVGLRTKGTASRARMSERSPKWLPARRATQLLAAILAGGLIALLVYQQWPGVRTILMWLAIVSLAGAGLWAGLQWPRAARAGLLSLAVFELWLASRALPFTAATAPYVLSLRNAPAALLAEMGEQPAAGRERFLSMSDSRYDPGDLAELRQMMAGSLPSDAIERLVRGAKQTEVIAPNLSLRVQLPGVDGYDGGLLPTQDYGKLQTLFLPADQRLSDGRMREQLHRIPAGQLLDLTGVRFVLTDKQNDLWADDVYYDLEQAVILRPGESIELDLQNYPRFPATALGIVSRLEESASNGTVAAEVKVRAENGQTTVFPVIAGRETEAGRGTASGVRVARPWPDWIGSEGQDYLARLEFSQALTPTSVTVRVPEGAPTTFVLQGLSLIDQRTGAHASVTVSPLGDFRRIHSGDVKIYERTLAPGRAWLVHGVQPSANDAETLRLLADPSFDPKQTVALQGDFRSQPPQAAQVAEKVRIVEFDPESIHLEAEVTQPALLVLADAFYPGWSASVDGTPVPILRANLMFRAVALAPGRHNVSFSYKPSSWRWGVAISAAMLVLLVVGVLAAGVPVRRFGTPKV